MGEQNKYINAAKHRITTIRLRTWTLSLAIIITLILYLLVDVITNERINWINFAFICALQIVVYSIYFPDGDMFGQKDSAYISNKAAYNDKAAAINQRKKIAALREFCEIEWEARKKRYIATQCGLIGISTDELQLLKAKTEKEIKQMTSFSYTGSHGEEKVLVFSKAKRRILCALLFKPLPVEKNVPETIMSAVETNMNKAIKDGSASFRTRSYLGRFAKTIVVGLLLAWVGFVARDGIGFSQIVSFGIYFTSLFIVAVVAFSHGETCSRVYKSHFYLDLANFIDAFNEWEETGRLE